MGRQNWIALRTADTVGETLRGGSSEAALRVDKNQLMTATYCKLLAQPLPISPGLTRELLVRWGLAPQT